LFLVVFNFVTK